MIEQQVKSFKLTDTHVELYSDDDATDCVVKIPNWSFEQIVAKAFNVRILK